jgi:uncharacterized alkaline shock family protein YloU
MGQTGRASEQEATMDADRQPTMRQPTMPYPGPPGPPGPPGADPPPPPGRGDTWIADPIVAKIAAAAAREVPGVADLRGGGIRRGWTRASDRRGAGNAGVRVEEGRAAIDLRLVVHDGVSIPRVVEAVRARVTERVEFATDLAVTKVDIGVVDVVGPAPSGAPGVGAPAASA